jgi:HEAT repeat protein
VNKHNDDPEQLAVRVNVQRLAAPYGGAADRRAADVALTYLLAHADVAHPMLLALLGTEGQPNPVTVIRALPPFGRPESVPVLERLLSHGPENVRMSAADALARHPAPAARVVLEEALQSDDPAAVGHAANGLRTRADPAACEALARRLDHNDAGARYAVIRASAALGCLSQQALAGRVHDDPDPDIRALATKTQEARSWPSMN